MVYDVRLFGAEASAAGARVVRVEMEEGATCEEVMAGVGCACAALRPMLAGCRLAVNHEFAAAGRRIGAGDEVALIGVVAGG